MLYSHDVSGAAGDGPEELIKQILKGFGNDNDDDVEFIGTGEKMEAIDVGDKSETSQVASHGNSTTNVKVKKERNRIQ